MLSPSSVVHELHFFKGRNSKQTKQNKEHEAGTQSTWWIFSQPAWTPAVSTLELCLWIRHHFNSSDRWGVPHRDEGQMGCLPGPYSCFSTALCPSAPTMKSSAMDTCVLCLFHTHCWREWQPRGRSRLYPERQGPSQVCGRFYTHNHLGRRVGWFGLPNLISASDQPAVGVDLEPVGNGPSHAWLPHGLLTHVGSTVETAWTLFLELYRKNEELPFKEDGHWTLKECRVASTLMFSNWRKHLVQKIVMLRGIDWEFGIDMYTLLYLKKMTNKGLLYSTGNSAQYSVII